MAKKLTPDKAKEILHDKSVHGHPLTEKQRKFFGAIAGGAPVKAQKGKTEKRSISKYISKQLRPIEKDLMTGYVDPYLRSQMQLANSRNIKTGVHNGPLDAIRHAGSAAGVVTEAIPGWVPAPLKILGANVLGAAHEFTAPGKMNWKETASDLYNNFIGSVVGALPISNYKKQQMIIDAQKSGILSNIGDPAIEEIKRIKSVPKNKSGGWLDKYDTAQKGKKVKIDGEDYNTHSSGYRDLYNEGRVGSIDKQGRYAGSHMTLPEVVVYPKDKDTKKFYDALSDEDQYAFDQMTKKYGPVNITTNKGKGIFSGTAGHYNPLTNTITINPHDDINPVGTYLSELAHKVQFDKQGKFDVMGDWVFNDLPAYVKQGYYNIKNKLNIGDRDKNIENQVNASPYVDPSTVEHEAHSYYQPKLRDEYIDYGYEDILGTNYNKYKSGGSLENYNDNTTSFPPGFVGMGNNTKGRNYSPAWGGQFAMGGSLPGAVGFTYARTHSPAPSEGPYAKKTMPSAENGMTYYQHGLDWKPKTISRYGSDVPKNQNAQVVLPNPRDLARQNVGSSESVSSGINNTYARAKANEITKEEKAIADYQKSFPGTSRDVAAKAIKVNQSLQNKPKDTLRAMTDEEARKMDIDIENEKWRKKYLNWIPGVETEGEKIERLQKNREEKNLEAAKRKEAVSAIDNNSEFTLPTGEKKRYSDMSNREKLYVQGEKAKGYLKVFPSASGDSYASIVDEYNPFPILSSWLSGFEQAPYLAKETGSVMPYVSAIADPAITIGALALANPELAGSELFTKQLLNPKKPLQNITKAITALEEGKIADYATRKLEKDLIKGTGKEAVSSIKDVSQPTTADALNTEKKDPVIEGGKLILSMIMNPLRQGLPLINLQKPLFKHGGVIEDDMGQWAHPGKITKINSNQITMKGVPYPVLGISDEGDVQMMYPEQEYTFKGKTVTEYPQKKKNGGWLDKYN